MTIRRMLSVAFTVSCLGLLGCGAGNSTAKVASNEELTKEDAARIQAELDQVEDAERAHNKANPVGKSASGR